MAKDIKEFLKEALKTEIELLKVFSVFLVALISAVATMLLGDFSDKDTLHKMLLIFGILGLIFVSLFFIIFVFRIFKHLNQLKK
jgi:hypothetical protein